jgi:arylsulfatase A-like enzyme
MPRPRNVLFITADQLRKDALGCYGSPIVQTPTIDRLAAGGVRFENAYAAYPVCAPNRASIVTGRTPTVHRLRANGMRLPTSERTLMQVLRSHGYGTYGAGKMHFGPQWPWPPDGQPISDPDLSLALNPQPPEGAFPWYGFEATQLTEDHRVGPYGEYLARHGYDLSKELHSASYPQHATVRSPFPEEHHQTTWITERAIDFLQAHPDERPFFLWVSYVHPHHPFNPPAPYDTLYDPGEMPLPVWDPQEVENWPTAYRKKYFARSGGHEAVGMCDLGDEEFQRIKAYYYGMVTQIDRNIQRLLETLAAQGRMEETLIVFSADHGENLGDHHLLFKSTTYEPVTSVPLIVSWPGCPQAGATRDLLASSIDIFPTLLDLLGLPTPEPSPIQGTSLAPALDDAALRLREALLIENPGARRTIHTEQAFLTWHGWGEQGELYDLRTDPDCLRNLWDAPQAAALQEELLQRLVQAMAENVDPLPVREGPW